MRTPHSLLLLTVLGACASAPSTRALEKAEYGAMPGNALHARIRAAFAPLLIEPESAEFEYGEPERGWGQGDQGFVYGWAVSTRVNSKNRFGAFTGWQTYKVLSVDGEVHSIYQPNGDDLFGNPKFTRVR